MPVFNFASTFGKKTSVDYGPLVDGVKIFEKELTMDDGTVSSGDHDRLIGKYNEVLNYPLTPSQRSNVNLLIADHEKKKSDIVFDSYNVDNINKSYKDDMNTFVKQSGNNISQFLEAKRLSLENKFALLNSRVENIYSNQTEEEAARNVFALRNEIQNTTRELENIYSAFDAIENPKGAMAEGLGVFVTADKDGRIIDIDVGSPENRSGFGKTNDTLVVTKDVLGNTISPVVTDLQIYGNEQESVGKDKIVKIGNNRYLKSQMSLSLLGESPVYEKEAIMGEAGQGVDLSAISIKQSIVPGEWAEGINSKNLYQQKPDGTYIKYVGATAEQRKKELESMRISPLPINRADESAYNRLSNETIADMTLMPMNYQVPTVSQPSVSAPTAPGPVTPAPGSMARVPSPTERAPMPGETQSIANRTLESAKGFFRSFFGR